MPDSWDYSQGSSKQQSIPHQIPMLTTFFCVMSIVVTLAYHTQDQVHSPLWARLGNIGGLSADKIWSGGYFSLITSVFVHAGIAHLLFNMLWLWRLGCLLEATISPVQYALFFFFSALVGSGCELATSGGSGVGMSGVVYAMFGLMWAGRSKYPDWRSLATRDNLTLFVIWGIVCLFATLTHTMNVANAAHGGGFLFGLSIGWLFVAPRRRIIWVLPLIGLIVLTVLSVTWMPWSSEWCFWKGATAFEKKDYPQAILYFHKSIRRGHDSYANWYNISAAWHNLAIQEHVNRNEEKAQQAEIQEETAALKAGTEKKPEDISPNSETDTPSTDLNNNDKADTGAALKKGSH